MAALTLGIAIDDRQVRQLFAKAPQAAVRRLMQLVEGATIDVQGEMRRNAPVAVTGHLRGGIKYTINQARFEGKVEPDVNYAAPVEYGSRPHWVSVRPGTPLNRWAKQKGISPYAVQRSIARKGTRAHPFVKPTYVTMKPRVERQIIAGMSQFAQELNSGTV